MKIISFAYGKLYNFYNGLFVDYNSCAIMVDKHRDVYSNLLNII